MNDLIFKTSGNISIDNREFTRLLGGFDNDSPMFLSWQAGELLGQETREITQNFERNKESFDESIDYIDLKSLITENDKTNLKEITNFFKSIGITHHKYGRASQWLAFSFSGMMKLVKIATTKESWSIYDDFLEDYFKTKAENIVMEKTLEETKDTLIEEQKYILGSIIIESDTTKKIELLKRNRKIEEQIKDIEVTLTKEKLMEQVQDSIEIADRFINSGKLYDVGEFSKILDIPNFGRTNFFRWLRDNKILMANNKPYSSHMSHFKVIPIENNRFANSKTLIKSQGISYIVKKLIKDDKIQEKTYEEVISSIDNSLKEIS